MDSYSPSSKQTLKPRVGKSKTAVNKIVVKAVATDSDKLRCKEGTDMRETMTETMRVSRLVTQGGYGLAIKKKASGHLFLIQGVPTAGTEVGDGADG